MLSDKGELPGCTYGIESSAALQFLRCFTSPKNQLISPLLEMKKNQKTRKTTIKHNSLSNIQNFGKKVWLSYQIKMKIKITQSLSILHNRQQASNGTLKDCCHINTEKCVCIFILNSVTDSLTITLLEF